MAAKTICTTVKMRGKLVTRSSRHNQLVTMPLYMTVNSSHDFMVAA